MKVENILYLRMYTLIYNVRRGGLWKGGEA